MDKASAIVNDLIISEINVDRSYGASSQSDLSLH